MKKKVFLMYQSLILPIILILFTKVNAIKLKNIIKLNFIDNYDIYLPGIQILDKKTIHKIKNHKFTLNIDILPYEVNETYNIQKKALKKMKI